MRLLLTLSLLLTLLTNMNAQEEQKIPQLNDHVFVPLSSLRTAFINSNFSSTLGLLQSSNVPFELAIVDGKTIKGEIGGLLMASLGFTYQQKVKDWLSFRVSTGLSTRVGTSFTGLLTQGINSVAGFNMSWLLKLASNEKYMLSGSVQVSNYSGTFINITNFVQDIIDQNPNPSISSTIPAVNSGVGLRFAYGFNDLWGLRASGNVNYGEGFSRAGSDFSYKLQTAFDINLAQRTSVPLGFALWYEVSTQPENIYNTTRTFQSTGAKIAYMGTNDFSLGLELTYIGLPISVLDEKIGVIGANITTRYYFN